MTRIIATHTIGKATKFVQRSIVAAAVALSFSAAMVASSEPAAAHGYHRMHHRHSHMGYRMTGRSGYHSCMNKSYGTRGVHFRRGC